MNILNKSTKLFLLISMFFGCVLSATAGNSENYIKVEVYIYGKGGASGGGTNGGTVTVCPEKDNAVCAKIIVDIPLNLKENPYEFSIKEWVLTHPLVDISLFDSKEVIAVEIESADLLYFDIDKGTAVMEDVIIRKIK